MLKMFHRHAQGGESPAFWEEFGSDGSFEERLRFCEVDPLRPLFLQYARPGTRMLEGGCGQGQYVAYYAARGVDIIGLDFARDWLRRLRARDGGLKLCAGDVAALPFRSESFDVYYSGGVVEHFEGGAEPALREARRVLRPGGALLISVPYFSPLRQVLSLFRRTEWKRVSRPERVGEDSARALRFYQYCYTPTEFTKTLSAVGLRVLATQGYAILWGLYDISLAERVLTAREGRRGVQCPSAADSEPGRSSGNATAGASANRNGRPTLLKRLVVAEDARVPLGGLFVRLGRWACANMMMYVCVRAENASGTFASPERRIPSPGSTQA